MEHVCKAYSWFKQNTLVPIKELSTGRGLILITDRTSNGRQKTEERKAD